MKKASKKTATMWAVIDDRGEILAHTIQETRSQAEDTFRQNAYPYRPNMYYWTDRGYKAVELNVTYEVKNG